MFRKSVSASGRSIVLRRAWLRWGAAFLAIGACAIANAQGKGLTAKDAEFRDFVVRGAIIGATQVELTVVTNRGEVIDGGIYTVKNNAFEGSVPLPLGVSVEVRIQATDFKGNLLAQGSQRALFMNMTTGSSNIEMRAKSNLAQGNVLITPVKLQIVQDSGYGSEKRQYQLIATDARGGRVEFDPTTVSWEVPFPERTVYIPCKPSRPDSVGCIELNVPIRINPYILACWRDVICVAGLGGDEPPPPPPVGYKAISAGKEHTCGLTTDGRILCWGANGASQLGRATTTTCRLPPPLANTSLPCGTTPQEIICPTGSTCRYIALDAGYQHTCAIDTNNDVWCWGQNYQKQLGFISCIVGQPSPTDCRSVLTPTLVAVPAVPAVPGEPHSRFLQISAGRAHTCGVTTLGNVVCWGENVSSQSGGNGGSDPHHVTSQSHYTKVSAGTEHSCAVTDKGDLECWGENRLAQIDPINIGSFFSDPVSVRALHPALSGNVDFVATSLQNTCAHADISGVVCWGALATTDTAVLNGSVSDLELGFVPHSLIGPADEIATLSGGLLFTGLARTPLMRFPGSPNKMDDTTVGEGHYCAVHSSGEAYCWGKDNTFGQMGDGTTAAHAFLGRVLGP